MSFSDIKHTEIKTFCLGSAFGVPIIFNSTGDNIKSYSDVVLEPTSIWNYDNLYVVAVLWQQNGTNYRFINLVR